tara:strand:- start:20212 stop:20598 length:387 start_codon:yes stop_codon:yes gene_type:complete
MTKITFLFIGLLCLNSCVKKSENIDTMKKQLRHVVLFKFNNEATSADIKSIENAFIELPSKIKTIKKFEWGINNSPEGLNKELTHCFFVTFHNEEDRDKYLPHPAHKAFVAILKPHLEDVLVVDYWTK